MGSNNLNFKNFDSFYSLTFDELQNTVGNESGKDFGSMNMDELLRSIWSAEENQLNVGSTSGGGGGGGGAAPASNGQLEGLGNLHRQGSLILPRTLSHKTVDEVLRDISKEIDGGPHRQPTLGEITLEEFLVRAGVVREDTQLAPTNNNNINVNNINNNDNNVGSFGDLWHPVNRVPVNVSGGRSSTQQVENQQQQQQHLQILPKQAASGYGTSNAMVVQGVGANGVAAPAPTPSVSVTPVPYVFNGGLRGRRSAAVEKVVERRQKRMIKNRESAARSRARKQAYTTELEEEVAKLKEEQEELQKKQAEILEMQKNQFLEMMKQQDGAKRQCLRRTQTGSW
ncbi:hypothetical protein ABFS82_03G043200 [Erythranthe guttata]|uniref:ABSCISIC ACID-INSENSITIVE 5-like protein 5 n=1 Tax=Erythranthe guttata TaxID=4155 RepID=UPI00064DEA25|nr:PREDICTED: ABSCISIC ACID-INSENSITIVE 5-like protein 5 [Erythranthe guttata]|eukprot:XP_012851747.1 PREDICTED: ABSCISIC ACID-INSENSITIVE 5-like protein 5 [Erythranthe guttata]